MVSASSSLQDLRRAFSSWRTAAVTLQSFPSAMPLGLVLTGIPAWLTVEKVDIKTIGLMGLVQLPWTLKFLWSPLMDRYAPPFLGRKRGWAVVSQAMLLLLTLGLAAVALDPRQIVLVATVTLAIAFASASQDIAIDAYAVEVLRREEQGVAAGARTVSARVAFLLGRSMIALAQFISWPLFFVVHALLYLPAMVLMYFSPEPEHRPAPPATLRNAVWDPLRNLFRQQRAVEIIAFVILYKFGDNLASALITPFLLETGFNLNDVGPAIGIIGLIGTLAGAAAGGVLVTSIGLGHSLWLFGALQAFSNVGYILVAQVGVNRPLLYGAQTIETFTSAMGTVAFSVLLLRLTQKRFSATQYALLSSIFAIGRTFSQPLAGVLIDVLGWTTFFTLTIAAALPGLFMLRQFAPLGVREPEFSDPDADLILDSTRDAQITKMN